MSGLRIIHFIPNPVSAKRFVEPIALALSDAGYDVLLAYDNEVTSKAFEAALACPNVTLPFGVSRNPLRTAAGVFATWRLLARVRPQAIHAHQTRGALVPLLLAWARRVPTRIYHNHGAAYWGTTGILQRLFGWLERINCALATHVLFVNPALRRVFLDDGLVAESKATLPDLVTVCGIDFDEFRPDSFDGAARAEARRSLGVEAEAFVVAFVGRPFKRKGFDFLLEAWDRWSKTNPAARLVLAGCSPEDVERRGFPVASVRALGYVTNIRPVYAAADVLALPSDHEGFPYALLEAAAAQRCSITSAIPGTTVFVQDNVNGLQFAVGDREAFIACLERLNRDRPLLDRLARAARIAAERHAREPMLARFVDFYRSRLGS